MKTKLLFICSGNFDRSPTAELIFRNSKQFEARSAGILPSAVKHVSQKMIDWADKIFVMSEKEDGHLTYLQNNFDLGMKEVYDLDVPNIYNRGDPELVKVLSAKLEKYLELK